MNQTIDAADISPTACGFCGRGQGEARRFIKMRSVNPSARVFEGTICDDCVRAFILHMAHDYRDEFERLIEEARAFMPKT